MTPERWRKVEEVFESALERAPEERSAYLTQACGGDAALREQVETLIASYEQAGSFIEEPAVGTGMLPDTLVDETVSTVIGRRLGSYKIVREIGRGGMGSVYLAMRADDEYQKRVAIKLIKRGMDTDFIIRRFRNERQILASLDHQNIARLLDGGTTEDGLPYFVMEYVEGQPIHHYCDTEKLSTPERLRLFLKACAAVQYAHHNLIIHRDLKPSNILVTAEGTPKLLDFGIAKILNPEIASQTLDPTTAALRLMTPEYASPEQVRGLAATTTSDVYSLGVLLYELLTGHRPYRLYNRLPEELARVICDEEPERPSAIISRIEHIPVGNGSYKLEITPESVSKTRDGTPDKLRRQLAGNLDNIILKALRKEPQRRYTTVAEFAEDLRRHLDGQSISAPAYFIPARSEFEMSDTPTGTRAIAVLPFKMLRLEEKSDEYLGLGMADAIITKLSNIRRIVVRPTSSVLKYADGESDLLAAGYELDVGFVLDGRIQRAHERVRVTVQLIRVRDGAPLWAAKFDEKFTDIFTVEDSISGQVAQALMPKLSGEEQEMLSKRETENAAAYQAYLKGRYYWNTFTEDGLAQAIFHFMEAIEEDPNYAQAYAGVADYYNYLGVWGVLPPKESFAAAKDAAAKALQLDDTLAEAHTSLAFALLAYDWDWEEAEKKFKRAIELNPSYATAHQWYAYLAGAQGRHAEAITEIEYAQKLDPLSPVIASSASLIFYNARQYDRSIEELDKALELDPNYFVAHQAYGWCHAMKGRFEEAIAAARKAAALSSRNPIALWSLGYALAVAGREDEAREVLREMMELGEKRFVSPYFIACVYVGLDEQDEAFKWLEKAYTDRDWWLLWMRVQPNLDTLRSDPRFQNLLRRVARDEAETARIAVHETSSDKESPHTTRTEAPPVGWRPSRAMLVGAGVVLAALVGLVIFFFIRNAGTRTRPGGVARLTNHQAADVQPRWSPDGQRIAFASARDGKLEIYTMDAYGENLKRLTSNSVDDFSPAWSPDGKRIAFTSKRDGHDEIYVMNADGSLQENLTKHPASDSRPSWSPDGRKLVFTSNRSEDEKNFDLYVMDADGSNPVRLTDDAGYDSDPAWSPDGQQIAFTSNRTGNFEVYLIDAGGGPQTNISHDSSFNGKPAWSPDGQQIAFTSNRTSKFEIYVMGADGSRQRQLTHTSVTNDEPAWSNDGAEIVYQSERDGNNDIYVMSAATGETLTQQPAQAGARSIAVLPFRTVGGVDDKPYLGPGLADSLTTKLAQLRQLTVRPSGEVRRYLNSTVEPRSIGRELGVECVLDGEVSQTGDRIQVTVRLFNVKEGSLLWSEKFDQKMMDMQAMQDMISNRVARAMLLELTTDEQSQLAKHYTDNGEAYQLYLVGRYHSGRRTPADLRQAISYFERAIQQDPSYALAHAGRADAYGLLALYDAQPPQESFLKSKEAALKALELDNTLAEAHTSLAYVKLYYDRDLIGADEEFKKAIELNPNYATAHHWRALALSAAGRHDDALAEIRRAQEIDPSSLIINTALGNLYLFARRYDEAIEQCRKTIEMNQKFAPAHTILRQAYEKKGLFNEALAEFQKERELAGDSPGMRAKLGHLYAATGKRAEAIKVVNELVALRKQQFIQSYEIAQIYAMLNEQPQALEWIARAGEEHSFGVAFAAVDPDLENLRANPQFNELLKRLGLKP